MQVPYLMNKEVMAKTAQLDSFDEELYKAKNYIPCFKTRWLLLILN